ncbi:MAG: hypothetical protein JO069_19025 [Verrucomicrobia bacterium]|nr:hypothetical protein [Verrucomicrobiota bacterium]
MVEVLAIFGFLCWLVSVCCDWLSSLPFFPAIVLGAVATPPLALHHYFALGRRWRLRGWASRHYPIPPDRFYWRLQQRRLRQAIFWNAIAALASWWNVTGLPVQLSADAASITGWANALVGSYTGARLLSCIALFVRAAQWFDSMSPTVVGLLRRTMYRLSDNYEYLGEQRRDPEKEKVY